MYVVREKKSKKVIHINPAPLKQALEGRDVYFKYDPFKMEIGKCEGPLPEHFDITADGRIVEQTSADKAENNLIEPPPEHKIEEGEFLSASPAELLKQGRITLDEIRQQKKAYLAELALQRRREILPDYKIQNALMGIYEEGVMAVYKRTIEAFREEFKRLEELIDEAESFDDLEGIEADFPESLAGG